MEDWKSQAPEIEKSTPQTTFVKKICLDSTSISQSFERHRVTDVSFLPEEIIKEEILSRLPVKSLLRLRCVSKSWRSLIVGKRFIKKHLQNSTGLAHHRVLLCSQEAKMSGCSLLSLFDKPDIHALESNFGTYVAIDSLSLVGCCNGLVCILLNHQQFILWNPSTRISKKLPDIHNTPCYIWRHGFSCDELSGNYKVIAIVTSVNQPTICKVYSLKTDSWKEIPSAWDLAFCHCEWKCFCNRGRLASGKLHWEMIHTEAHNIKWDIVAFDLKRDVFDMVKQPSSSSSKACSWQWLEILRGVDRDRLLVLRYYEAFFEFWVMKEYGVTESWEKLMVVLNDSFCCDWTSPSMAALCIHPPRQLLLMSLRCSLIYDQEECDNAIRILVVYDRKCNRFYTRDISAYDCDIYVESLVSLH